MFIVNIDETFYYYIDEIFLGLCLILDIIYCFRDL